MLAIAWGHHKYIRNERCRGIKEWNSLYFMSKLVKYDENNVIFYL